ncbi:MAG TPA: hypothetical protein DIS62_05680 [Candidatus Kerfeldbacteria bacterium]|nr:hypothetical protein [Candidatus Kerfeldbacteria bacterium]
MPALLRDCARPKKWAGNLTAQKDVSTNLCFQAKCCRAVIQIVGKSFIDGEIKSRRYKNVIAVGLVQY